MCLSPRFLHHAALPHTAPSLLQGWGGGGGSGGQGFGGGAPPAQNLYGGTWLESQPDSFPCWFPGPGSVHEGPCRADYLQPGNFKSVVLLKPQNF